MLIALVRINNIKINELKFISSTDLHVTQLLDDDFEIFLFILRQYLRVN